MLLSPGRARCQILLWKRCRYYIVRSFSTETSKVRNIGIVAHIDAGKTTVTERILYETGTIRAAGNIKHGNTTTDFLPCEQSRGITVNSAFVQARYRDHLFNIIDTPGHIDFNFEVERSLRVLDGAVVVVDGTRGVEAQTVTVWRQLDKFQVPRLIFLNKLDRDKRDVAGSLRSIRDALRTAPVLVNLPRFNREGDLVGVVNTDFCPDTVTETVETLAELDEEMEDLYLAHECEAERVPHQDVSRCLKRQIEQGRVTPVCVGSGLVGVGVQECLQLIIDYLPSPLTAVSKLPSIMQDAVCGVVFKSSLDPNRGVVCQSRVYSGTLTPRSKLLNLRCNTVEQVSNLLRVDADKLVVQGECGPGGITVISGCKHLRTGDVFVAASLTKRVKDLNELVQSNNTLKLTMSYGNPLFFCNVEAPDALSNDRLEKVLTAMTFEDPTLTLKRSETGELVLGGTGQLHLSVVRDRIRDEHGLECKAYKFRVNYLETVSDKMEYLYSCDLGELRLTISPSQSGKEITVRGVSDRVREVVEPAIVSSLTIGPLIGFQLTHCQIVASFSLHPPTHSKFPSKEDKKQLTTMVKSGIKSLFSEHMSLITLCEPFAEVAIEGPQQHCSAIIADFSLRSSGCEHRVSFSEGGDWFTLTGEAPLSKLSDLGSSVRQISRGSAAVLRVEMVRYGSMEPGDARQVVQMFKDGVI